MLSMTIVTCNRSEDSYVCLLCEEPKPDPTAIPVSYKIADGKPVTKLTAIIEDKRVENMYKVGSVIESRF